MIERLPKLVRPGRAIDVGANVGDYTYALSKLATAVDAFEPQPALAAELKAFARSYAAHVNVHQCALSDQDGEVILNIPIIRGRFRRVRAPGLASIENTGGPFFDKLLVPVRRLDDFGFQLVTFIKIDVEGHEASVLRGAAETIATWKPTLLVEIEQRHISIPIDEVFSNVAGMGYRGYFYCEGQQYSLDEFSLKRHQLPFLDKVDRAMSKGSYVNNFIFEPI